MKRVLLFASLLATLAPPAMADDLRLPREPNPNWVEECGSCHVAYPPSLLSADNWRALMQRLDKHFGANASLDATSAAQIGAWLERNAARRGERNAAASLRITDTRWFVAEHHDIGAATWRDPAIRSASNCAACHKSAARGIYDDKDIVIPRTRR